MRRVLENWGVSYKRSWVTLSVTSRRQKITSLPRRDVKHHVATSVFEASITSRREISRRDVILIFLCHVATSKYKLSVTSRRGISRRDVIWSCPLPRRDVGFHVATSFGHVLCHVATWDFTSRRRLVCPLSRRDLAPHIATWRWF